MACIRFIEVPRICQYPSLPTGCESVAAAMVLQFYGEDILPEKFAGEWLECDSKFDWKNDRLYGPDPDRVFVGDPFSRNSYGCFAPVIENAVSANSSLCRAKVIRNRGLEYLCSHYIDAGKPLLIWTTMGMKPAEQGKSWILSDDSIYTWISGEHCMVLVGYGQDYYFVNDPMSGSTVCFEKEIMEDRFRKLGSQAVYIYPVVAESL